MCQSKENYDYTTLHQYYHQYEFATCCQSILVYFLLQFNGWSLCRRANNSHILIWCFHGPVIDQLMTGPNHWLVKQFSILGFGSDRSVNGYQTIKTVVFMPHLANFKYLCLIACSCRNGSLLTLSRLWAPLHHSIITSLHIPSALC